MSIKQLDKFTIEKIAAGEVIESPFSIVKELVENAIDANATSITVEIKNGGKNYIRVTDNGSGIEKDDIELAFKRHATSKIEKFDDLYNSYSLGFRGEALSSIANSSKVKLITKTENDDIGTELVIFDDKVLSRKSIATNTGSTFVVQNLFDNIPVRKKFLKSDITESNKITKLMYTFAISNQSININYIKDNREIFRTNSRNSLEDNIIELIDTNLSDKILYIKESNEYLKMRGIISSNNYYRGNRSLEFLFVNGRYVYNKDISRIIENNYKSIIPNGKFPAFFIFFDISADLIDVNIHPNKKEIKFTYEDEILQFIDRVISEKLNYNIRKKEIEYKDNKQNQIPDFYSDYENILNKYNNIAKEDYKNSYNYNTNNSVTKGISSNKNSLSHMDLIIKKDEKNEAEILATNNNIINIDKIVYKNSIFGRFSIFENDNNEVLILDHRTSDKKILFEKYRIEIADNKVSSQVLLKPEILNLKEDDFEKVFNNIDTFRKIGFSLDIFGKNTIIIREYPLIFYNPENLDIFYSIIDVADKELDVIINKLYKIIDTKAFRKGDKIDKKEAYAIIEKLNKYKDPYHTNDGKACIITIKYKQLEKYFE